jgi:hypothetical protein
MTFFPIFCPNNKLEFTERSITIKNLIIRITDLPVGLKFILKINKCL